MLLNILMKVCLNMPKTKLYVWIAIDVFIKVKSPLCNFPEKDSWLSLITRLSSLDTEGWCWTQTTIPSVSSSWKLHCVACILSLLYVLSVHQTMLSWSWLTTSNWLLNLHQCLFCIWTWPLTLEIGLALPLRLFFFFCKSALLTLCAFNGNASLVFMSNIFYKAHLRQQFPSRGNKAFLFISKSRRGDAETQKPNTYSISDKCVHIWTSGFERK